MFVFLLGCRRSGRPAVPGQENHDGVQWHRRGRRGQAHRRGAPDRQQDPGPGQVDHWRGHFTGKSKPQVHLNLRSHK